jgi:predicted TPR repeat methyltransferase
VRGTTSATCCSRRDGSTTPSKRTSSASRRYAHRASYIDDTIAAAGLALEALRKETLRTEAGLPVVGSVVVARSP